LDRLHSCDDGGLRCRVRYRYITTHSQMQDTGQAPTVYRPARGQRRLRHECSSRRRGIRQRADYHVCE
jgi:hypothetical protein